MQLHHGCTPPLSTDPRDPTMHVGHTAVRRTPVALTLVTITLLLVLALASS
jgi:hypothetical protein